MTTQGSSARPSVSRLLSGAKRLWPARADDDYNLLSIDDEEKGFKPLAFPPAYDPKEIEDIDDPQSNISDPISKKKSSWGNINCCIICGLHISLRTYIIAFTTIIIFFVAFPYARNLVWKTKDNAIAELEAMPSFGDSLGCLDAPHFLYGTEKQLYEVPVGARDDHFLNVRGGAVGTLVLVRGSGDNVSITSSVRSTDESLLDSIIIEQHDPNLSTDSFWRIITPRPETPSSCLRYDLTVRIPPNLKKLHLAAHAIAHIRFQDEHESDVPEAPLDDLFVTFYSAKNSSLFMPTTHITAHHTFFEMTSGWMSGSVALLEAARIATQRGDARAHLEIHPAGNASLGTASLQTVTGSGRSDFMYYEATPARRIDSDHISSMYGDMHLHYEHAGFRGHVDVDANSWTAEGLNDGILSSDSVGDHSSDELPWVGDRNGSDVLKVRSDRGMVMLHF